MAERTNDYLCAVVTANSSSPTSQNELVKGNAEGEKKSERKRESKNERREKCMTMTGSHPGGVTVLNNLP